MSSSKSSRRVAMNFGSASAIESRMSQVIQERECVYEEFEDEGDDFITPHTKEIQDEIQNEREEKTKKSEDFFSSILPESTLVEGDTMFPDFFRALWTQHDWWAVCAYPSMQLSRYLRWVGLMNDIMLTLLFDTLFFMVMYPTGVCEIITDEEMCLSIPSGVMASMNQCEWDEDELTCAVAEPPEDFVFNSMVSLIVIILSLPPSLVMWSMLCSTVNCRPDFDAIGLDADYWFGRPVEHLNDVNSAALSAVANEKENESDI